MRPDHRLWGLWLFALLLVPVAVMISGWRPNDVPELAVTPEPGFAPERFLDDDYYRDVDAWLAENNGTEGVGIYARWLIDYRLFGDSTHPDIAVGDDGLLFSRNYLDTDCETLRRAAGPEVPAEHRDQVTHTITLSKVTWLVDALRPHDRPTECAQRARLALLDAEADDPATIPVNTAIATDPRGAFLPDDSHWSPEGRLLAAEALVDHLAPGLWDPAAVREAQVPRLQVYRYFLGVLGERTMPGHVVERDAVHETLQETEAVGLLMFQHSTTEGADVVPGVTYLFGDSQLAYVMPYIDQYFEELIYVGRLRRTFAPVDLSAFPPPDRIVAQSSEIWVDAEIRDNGPLNDAIARLTDR